MERRLVPAGQLSETRRVALCRLPTTGRRASASSAIFSSSDWRLRVESDGVEDHRVREAPPDGVARDDRSCSGNCVELGARHAVRSSGSASTSAGAVAADPRPAVYPEQADDLRVARVAVDDRVVTLVGMLPYQTSWVLATSGHVASASVRGSFRSMARRSAEIPWARIPRRCRPGARRGRRSR